MGDTPEDKVIKKLKPADQRSVKEAIRDMQQAQEEAAKGNMSREAARKYREDTKKYLRKVGAKV